MIEPFLFMVDPITESPLLFSTGIDSPVSMDSSIEVSPLVTLPSTGIFSPGFISKVSPTLTLSSGSIISLFSLITRASFACKFNNSLNALVVCDLARASKYLPRRINVIKIALVSKYKCG